MFRRLVIFGFLLAMLPLAIHAQPMDQPTPQQLFDAAREALGNPEKGVGLVEATAQVTVDDRAYKALVSGRFNSDELGDATFTMITPEGTVTYGETDGTIWFESDKTERKDLSPAMAMFVRGHQFHRRLLTPELEFKAINPDVHEDTFAGEKVFVVEGTTHAGARLKYFYHVRTKMPVGMHLTVQDNSGDHPMDFTFKEWRTSADQTLFWRIDINDRGKIFVYKYDRILLLP
ncbi:MAG: hypothetical protein HWE25_02760 [Alphaproteobacteria bacterium]|nr:hypothetical protein [Alphaproteobacteria bacterium]